MRVQGDRCAAQGVGPAFYRRGAQAWHARQGGGAPARAEAAGRVAGAACWAGGACWVVRGERRERRERAGSGELGPGRVFPPFYFSYFLNLRKILNSNNFERKFTKAIEFWKPLVHQMQQANMMQFA